MNCGSPQWTTTQYDGLDRVRRVETADGAVTITAYQGDEATITDPAGAVANPVKALRKLVHDAQGRLSTVTEDPSGVAHVTSYGDNVLDNLTSVTQTGANGRTFTYDSFGRLLTALQPEWEGQTSYGYDDSGNLTSKTDPAAVVATLQYDGLNRLMKKSYSDAITPAAQYCYDGKQFSGTGCVPAGIANSAGRLTEVMTADTKMRRTEFDVQGRVTRSVQTTATSGTTTMDFPFRYVWDTGGWLKQVSYPTGRVVNYAADVAGRVTGAERADGSAWAAITQFTPGGAPQQVALGNGLLENWTYSAARWQARRMKLGTAAEPEKWGKLEWSYCPGLAPDAECAGNNGNVQAQWIQPLNEQQQYSYDGLNRLSGTSSSWTEAWDTTDEATAGWQAGQDCRG